LASFLNHSSFFPFPFPLLLFLSLGGGGGKPAPFPVAGFDVDGKCTCPLDGDLGGGGKGMVGVVGIYGVPGAKNAACGCCCCCCPNAGELSPRPTPGGNAGEPGSTDPAPLIDGGAKFGDGAAE